MGKNSTVRQRSKRAKWAIRIGVFLFFYTVIGFFVVPAIIKSQMIKRIPPIALRQVSIEQVKFNPYALSLTIRGFSLKEPNGDVFLSFDQLYVNFQLSSIFRRKFTFAEISLVKPFAQVSWLPDHTFNFANILTNLPPSPPGPPKPLPALLVFQFSVTNGAVAVADLSRKTPFRTEFIPIDVNLTNLTTVRDKNSPYSFIARTGEGEVFAWGGYLSLNPLSSAGTFRLGGFAIPKYAPYANDYARFQIAGGKVDVAADYSYESVNNPLDLQVSNAMVHLDNFELKASDTGETVLKVPSLTVRNASAGVVAQTAHVGAIESSDGFVLARRNHDRSINLLSELILPTNAPAPAAKSAKPPGPPGAPWSAKIDEIAFTNYEIKVEDRSPAMAASLDMDQLAFDVKNISNASNAPVTASLSLRFQKTGSVAVDGTATLLPPSADIQLAVSNIDLRAVQPYVHEQARLLITSGAVNVHGRARYAAPEPGAPLASFDGDYALNNFITTDDVLFKNFITWDALAVDGIHLTVQPDSLKVDQIKLTGLSGSLVVGPDKRPNILTILRRETNAAPLAASTNAPSSGETVASVANPAGETATNAAPAVLKLPDVSVGAILLDGASFHLSDQSLEPHCTFDVAQFGGSIKGLSTQPGATAIVDFTGKVDDRSPFKVSGKITPGDMFADIAVTFTNTELTAFTPYTEKFAGRPLEKGKLSFAVHYVVQKNDLKAENGFYVDQLTFGPKNNSPDATSLPVKLAVALLKDRNGRISLNVPIAGKLNDPKLRIGPIIWHVVVNLIEKAATSPFSLLGAAFGGGDELSFVDFPPGRADYAGTETNKLNVLAKALFERPTVTLEITGAADPAADHEALARIRLDEQIKALWLKEQGSPTNTSLAKVNIEPKEYERLVRKLYRQKFGTYKPTEAPSGSEGSDTNQPASTIAASASAKPAASARNPKAARYAAAENASFDHGAGLLMTPLKRAVLPASVLHPASSVPLQIVPGEPAPAQLTERQTELLDMQYQLVSAMQITEDDLRDLMNARAKRVQKYLLDTGKVTADRLFILAPKPVSPTAKGQSRANMSLD
jgi:hypothetical protein